MIRRNASKYIQNQESLVQNSFTAIGGVDSTKPATTPNTIYSVNNLDIDYDGGLILRKPLIVSKEFNNVFKVFRTYNDMFVYVIKDSSDNYRIKAVNSKNVNVPVTLEATDVTGAKITISNFTADNVFNLENAAFTNANTRTIIYNVTVNFNNIPIPPNFIWEYVGTTAYDNLSKAKRYLRLEYVDGVIKLSIIRPEINTLYENELGIVFNQNLDNTFAIRDVYDSSFIAINGILAYKTPQDIKFSRHTHKIPAYVDPDVPENPDTPEEPVPDPDIITATKSTPDTEKIYFNVPVDWAAENGIYSCSVTVNLHNWFDLPSSIVKSSYVVKPILKYKEQSPGVLTVYFEQTEEFVNKQVELLKLNRPADYVNNYIYFKVSMTYTYEVGTSEHSVSLYSSDTIVSNTDFTQTVSYTTSHDTESKTSTINITAETDCRIQVSTCNHIYNFKLKAGDEVSTLPDAYVFKDNYHGIISFVSGTTVAEITESDTSKIVDVFNKNSLYRIVLKAFVNFVPNNSKYYCVWEKTYNGVDWETVTNGSNIASVVIAEPVSTSESLEGDTVVYRTFSAHRFGTGEQLDGYGDYIVPISPTDFIETRPDVLFLNNIDVATYRFRIFDVSDTAEDVTTEDGSVTTAFKLKTQLASKEYAPRLDTEESLLDSSDFKNTSYGDKLYYKRRIFTYGSDFKNNIYVTDFDSFVCPTNGTIDLDTVADANVTGVVPWRDYLIAYTDKTIHLITLQDAGFLTKTISTSIGISEKDSKTCVPILNGIIFKSDNKIYSMYPNFSSGSETILNISEISKPIEHILKTISGDTEYSSFAFVDSEAYYLFIPQRYATTCLKYEFSHKTWSVYTYDCTVYDYKLINVSDIRLYAEYEGVKREYYFNKTFNDIGVSYNYEYGDILTTKQYTDRKCTPISFFVDSGQKTDNLSLTKQFVESKIIVATLDTKDSFNFNVNIHIDGNVFNKHIDLNTDGALLRTNSEQILTLGTSADSEDSDTFNTLRQMFIRYSGKGKTIRHIISGTSLYRFKIYEIFYRYKILNVKQ